jgi:ankyrin repeat protein
MAVGHSTVVSPGEEAAVKEYSYEFLEAARYGELDDLNLIFSHPRLKELIRFQSLVEEETGTSALMLASANGHLDCMQFLTESVQVDVNYSNKSGNTALHWASLNGHSACVEYLISKNANVLAENIFHRTPFDEAIERDQKDCCELLVKEEVRLNNAQEDMQDEE